MEIINIFFKKIKHIPRHRLGERLVSGIKKRILQYPQYISIQTVSACNLKCKHCFINDYHTEIEDGVIKIMQFNEFVLMAERLKDIIKNANYLTFSTFEAILNKNIFSMMDVILDINPKMQFPFLSNAMELHAEKIHQLEKYPVPEINISLDGFKKETVERFKTEVDFDKIIATIKLLSRSTLKNKMAVTFVAHRDNIIELPDYVDFVNTLGVKQIYVSNILTFTKSLEGMELYQSYGNQTAQAIFIEAIKRAKHNKQIISLPELSPTLKGCQACESFFINSNGDVAPCDFLAVSTPFTFLGETKKSKPVKFGNIFEQDPVKIWRSDSFKKFRNAHRTAKDLPNECTHCIDAYGLMCSNRKTYQ